MSLPPNIAYIRNTQDYAETFSLIMEWNIFVAATILLTLILALIAIRNIINRYFPEAMVKLQRKQSVETEKELKSISLSNHEEKERQKKSLIEDGGDDHKTAKPKSSQKRQQEKQIIESITESQLSLLLKTIITVLIYLEAFLVASMIQNRYMFGFFGRTSIVAWFTVLVLFFILCLPSLLISKMYNAQPDSWIFIGAKLIFCILIVVMTKDLCVCQYNQNYGLNLEEVSRWSTGFMRQHSLQKICKDRQICHLYATLPFDSSTTVFFNAHSGLKLEFLRFDVKLNQSLVKSINSSSPYRFDNIEEVGQRLIHSVFIKELTPSTTYEVEVYDQTDRLISSSTYRTLPNSQAQQVRIISGGDTGMTEKAIRITKWLAAYDPDVIVIGGDLAYDDGMRTCYYSWDNFYDILEEVNKKLNRLVPIILTIGNHDVGFDSMADVTLDIQRDSILPLFLYNPFHTAIDESGVPINSQRRTYHHHLLGPSILLSLDSGYLQSYEQQAAYIRQVAESTKGNYFLFANYHNPIFSTCYDSDPYSNDMITFREGLRHWVPLFDEFNFTTVMEHHSHYRKMTYRLINGSISNKAGTRYIGDGSWGVTDLECPYQLSHERQSIMEHFSNFNATHVWLLTLKKDGNTSKSYTLNHTAVNEDGVAVVSKVDSVSLPIF